MGKRTDAELHAALKRVGLVNHPGPPGDGTVSSPGKFDLDREVRDDSFSQGEKQLLALCRALVKVESKVLGKSRLLVSIVPRFTVASAR